MVEGTGFPGQIQARNPSTKAPVDLSGDATAGALFVTLWTWNTSTLAYEKVANINSKLDTIIGLLGDIKTNTTP